MVCKKCEKKLTAVAAPDTWKEGSNNAVGNYTSFLNTHLKILTFVKCSWIFWKKDQSKQVVIKVCKSKVRINKKRNEKKITFIIVVLIL